MVKRCGCADAEIVECTIETEDMRTQGNKSAAAYDKDEEKNEKVNKFQRN